MLDNLTIRNVEQNTEIHINRYNGEYWLDVADFGTVDGVNHTYKYLDQIGTTIYNTTLDPRNVAISGWVAGWSKAEVSRLKTFLNSFINPKEELELRVNNKKIYGYPTKSIAYSQTLAENNEILTKFVISIYCPYPLFTDITPGSVLVAFTEKKFHFPLVIPKQTGVIMGIRQPTLIATVNNPGDLPVGYIIEFKALGQVVNPILTDIGSQQFVEIRKVMDAGEVILIDTREGHRRVRGFVSGIESNYYHYRTYDSSWLQLARGINYLRYNAEENVSALEVTIRYEPGYLEVDT